MYLKIKNGTSVKQYTLTDSYAKPYIKVSGSILPLTTQDTTGLRLKVKANNTTYRPLEYGSASASATYYTTSENTAGLSEITTLTRESTSGTSYLTRESTSGTSYLTKVVSTETLFTHGMTHSTYWNFIAVLFAGRSTYINFKRSNLWQRTGTCTSIKASTYRQYSYSPSSYYISLYAKDSIMETGSTLRDYATYRTIAGSNYDATYEYTSSERTASGTLSNGYAACVASYPYEITQYTGTATANLAPNNASGRVSGSYSGTEDAQTIFETRGVGSVQYYVNSTNGFTIGSRGITATTATSYLTCSSTSATSYLTRSSISGYSGISSSSSESSGWQ